MTVTQWAMPTVDNIRAEMARKRKTQAGLAAVLGIAQSGASDRLRGIVPITVNELYVIADWLGVSPATFLVDPSGPSPTSRKSRDSHRQFAAAA